MDNDINTGKVCPYCKAKTEFVDSSIIYGKSYGMIYLCKPCNAYVGVHKGTDKALGRLANYKLRELKKSAHNCFDTLWQRKMATGFSKKEARTKAYKWLGQELNLSKDLAHIGKMNEIQCEQVIKLCKNYL